jgi:hypothetical protein
VAVIAVVDRGIVAVSACQAAVAILFTLLAMGVATRMLHVSVRDLLVAVWPATVAAAGLAVVLVLVDRAVSSPWPTLIAGLVAGVAVYGAILWLVARETLVQVIRTARAGRGTLAG